MDYNLHNIDEYLERYWAGESSAEEEALLQQYFRFGNVQKQHAVYSDLFVLEAEAECQVSEDFDAKLMAQIEGAPVVSIQRKKRKVWPWLAAACMVGMLVTVGIGLQKLDEKKGGLAVTPVEITVPEALHHDEDAIEAWNQTKVALMGLSARMNKGNKKSLHLSKFNQATEAVKGEKK